MKKILLKMMIGIVCLGVILFISASMVADILTKKAEYFAENYRWKRAGRFFRLAEKLDPYNAEIKGKYAEFILDTGMHKADKEKKLIHSIKLLKDARALNPENAEYSLKLGEALLAEYFLFDKKQTRLDEAICNLTAAYENDPNGFNVVYPVGCAGMKIWESLDKDGREMVIERLKLSLNLKPEYWEYVAELVWQKTEDINVIKQIMPDGYNSNESIYNFIRKNNLWQYRKAAWNDLVKSMKDERPEAYNKMMEIRSVEKDEALALYGPAERMIEKNRWSGKTSSGIDIAGGDMFASGIIYGTINIPEGAKKIVMKIKGTPANGIYPYLLIKLDGKDAYEGYVNNEDWQDYIIKISGVSGIKILSVEYLNDFYDRIRGEDRNLFVGDVRVE